MNKRMTVKNGIGGVVWAGLLIAISGCPQPPPDNGNEAFANTTDKTNSGADYIGSSSCRECHQEISEQQLIHGHAHKLTAIQGGPPQFPAEGTRAGVPNPPEGFTWDDIAYVIGGYTKKARFIDHDGYILTNGVDGVNTQWNLVLPINGMTPMFVPYEPDRETPKPYDYSCFVCHTTGPLPQDEDFPLFQENRPGFAGTWEEPGVQCESCHGPGGNHFSTMDGEVIVKRENIFVDIAGSKTCYECHNRPFNDDTGKIVSQGGYIQHHEQWPELRASGGHAELTCVDCHDPHRSTLYDKENAIVASCTSCHEDHNMAIHEGLTFIRGDYTESLSCVSCHMPLATKSAGSSPASVVGEMGRMGDTKTHIFRIDTRAVDYTSMFVEGGGEVMRDSQGRAAVTMDFVCFRCHNGVGNAGVIDTLDLASGVAEGMHSIVRP